MLCEPFAQKGEASARGARKCQIRRKLCSGAHRQQRRSCDARNTPSWSTDSHRGVVPAGVFASDENMSSLS